MIRTVSILLALGLAIAGVAGLGTHATRWLSGLDILTAVFACAVAATAAAPTDTAMTLIALSITTMVLAVAGLAGGAAPWLGWCTLAAAIGFLVVGIAAVLQTTARVERRRARRLGGPRPV
jgi:hypothetical protein